MNRLRAISVFAATVLASAPLHRSQEPPREPVDSQMTLCIVSNAELREFLNSGSTMDKAEFGRILQIQLELRQMKADPCQPAKKPRKAVALIGRLAPTARDVTEYALAGYTVQKFISTFVTPSPPKKK